MSSLAPSQMPQSAGFSFMPSLVAPRVPAWPALRSVPPPSRRSYPPPSRRPIALARRSRPPVRRSLGAPEYQQFFPMVRRIAMRLARRLPSHVSVEDLMSSGWVGAAEAFSRTESSMPVDELEAYLSRRVKGAMLDHLRSLSPATRHARNVSRRIARAVAKASAALGRQPEEREIAAALEVSIEEYRIMLSTAARSDMARIDVLDIDQLDVDASAHGNTVQPDEDADRRMLSGLVAAAIPTLSDRLQKILALYYQEGCTLKEIGAILGVTESRVSQLHTEAMHRLRAAVGKE